MSTDAFAPNELSNETTAIIAPGSFAGLLYTLAGARLTTLVSK
jgi:hypothetical protein